VTLLRLLLAWLPVAVWFLVGRAAAARWLDAPAAAPPPGVSAIRTAPPPAIEAGGVTLFASLWFDSLGAGGWWLLFALVGALVAAAPRLNSRGSGPWDRHAILLALADVVRYVVAGAILAWRLG